MFELNLCFDLRRDLLILTVVVDNSEFMKTKPSRMGCFLTSQFHLYHKPKGDSFEILRTSLSKLSRLSPDRCMK